MGIRALVGIGFIEGAAIRRPTDRCFVALAFRAASSQRRPARESFAKATQRGAIPAEPSVFVFELSIDSSGAW